MLKALKKEYADSPEYRKMLENEFDTRYNLAHPNIVMVNDLEEVPGSDLPLLQMTYTDIPSEDSLMRNGLLPRSCDASRHSSLMRWNIFRKIILYTIPSLPRQ